MRRWNSIFWEIFVPMKMHPIGYVKDFGKNEKFNCLKNLFLNKIIDNSDRIGLLKRLFSNYVSKK